MLGRMEFLHHLYDLSKTQELLFQDPSFLPSASVDLAHRFRWTGLIDL